MLEQMYPVSWIEQKAKFAFLMGITYSILGIFSGILLFRNDPALPAIAFTSLLLLPSLNKMLSIEEKQASSEKSFNISSPIKDHKDIFKVYIFIFLGILLTFSFFAVALPEISSSQIFRDQLDAVGVSGQATSFSDFSSILSNNIMVVSFFLLASFFYGSGSVFLLVWNASVWGTIFGVFARNAALASNENPFIYFGLTLLLVSPHVIAEASAYLLAAISGGIVSKATLREKLFSERFTIIIKDAVIIFTVALILLILGSYIEVYITKSLFNIFYI